MQALAAACGLCLYTPWHSRMAVGVGQAKARLADKQVLRGHIACCEAVRKWHLGQAWVFAPDGMGVIDPGIPALSILTAILPNPLHLTAATLA